ncbi:MAG: hypothetical protein WCO60_09220 [Verrucomicrobiota bacterium]
MEVLIAAAMFGFVTLLFVHLEHQKRFARETAIRFEPLPIGLFDRLQKKHPHLTTKDCQLVAQGLRQFFMCYHRSKYQFISMPSQVVDDLWHEFILFTAEYQKFCEKAFGRFLHHTPAVSIGSNKSSNVALRRCWWFTCKEENINPRNPTRLPLLFAIDVKLKIPEGFRYSADCRGLRKTSADSNSDAGPVLYCGSDFRDPSFDGGTHGFGDDSSHSGHSSGDSHGDSSNGDSGCGDSGGGCGGGCGGGD